MVGLFTMEYQLGPGLLQQCTSPPHQDREPLSELQDLEPELVIELERRVSLTSHQTSTVCTHGPTAKQAATGQL